MVHNGLSCMMVDNGALSIYYLEVCLTKCRSIVGTDGLTPPFMASLTLVIEISKKPIVFYEYMDYLVIDSRSAYNGILEGLALKQLKVVTYIYHLCLKFEISKGGSHGQGNSNSQA